MIFKRMFCLVSTVFAVFWISISSSQELSCESVFSDVTKFAQLATRNAEFSRDHQSLFEFYIHEFFGERRIPKRGDFSSIVNIAERYPELSKPALREQTLIFGERHYEPPQSLIGIVKRLKTSASQFQAQIFQPEVNIGFWQKLLLPLKKAELKGLNRQEQKAKKKEHKLQFQEYFDQVLTAKDREFLKDNSLSSIEKTVSVYGVMFRIREQMIEEGKDVQALSQAIVDLVHTSGFRNPHYTNMLKSQSALDQVKGLEKILNERDTVALELGFRDHFSELLEYFNVDHPTGSTKKENLSQVLLNIQKEVQNSPYTVAEQQVLRVRALSLQESPFRGCLGGDCSTSSYFELALDPNFIYFTLTNSALKSSGHITVVLGTAQSRSEKSLVKIAFVDKIQNIPQAMLLPMLEAVRLSLEELGYRLGLPKNVGNHNGLSNIEHIRTYMDSEVNALFTHQLEGFKPHENQYNFDRGYSRAYSKPRLLEFERREGDFKVEAGEIYKGSKIPEDFSISNMIDRILSLKDSKKEEDQILFINDLELLTRFMRVDLRKNFLEDYLISTIQDKKLSFKVRKKSLYTLFELREQLSWKWAFISKDKFLELLSRFSLEEKTEIIGEMSNWKNSHDSRKVSFIRDLSENIFSWSTSENEREDGLFRVFRKEVKDILNNSPLKQIVNFNMRFGIRRQTVFFIFAKKGDREMIELLLDNGMDINARDINRETVLFLSARNGDREMAEFLIDKGVDINAKNVNGETVLFLAMRNGDQEMVEFLIDKGADVKLVKRMTVSEWFYLQKRMLGKKWQGFLLRYR